MNVRIRPLTIVALVLSLALMLSACSGKNGEPSTSSSASPEPTIASSPSHEPSPASPFPRTISAANGSITIQEAPKKVAVVHWGYTDSMLLFDLDSLAVVLPFTEKQSVLSTESYKPYIDRLDELTIVGENTSVNLEALLAYAPDLIIAGNATNTEITAELEKIATTVILDEEKANIWGDWPSVVTAFGEILGQEDAAEKYIAEYRELLSTAKEKLTQVEGSVAFVQVREKAVWLQGTDYLKPYYEGLGLKAPEGEEASNGAEITLEGLSKLDPDHLFLGYFNYSDKSIPALTDEWDDSAVWSKLKSVQKDQLYAINGELALGYGPIGNTYGVNAVLAALDK